jgi:hypothetical protein
MSYKLKYLILISFFPLDVFGQTNIRDNYDSLFMSQIEWEYLIKNGSLKFKVSNNSNDTIYYIEGLVFTQFMIGPSSMVYYESSRHGIEILDPKRIKNNFSKIIPHTTKIFRIELFSDFKKEFYFKLESNFYFLRNGEQYNIIRNDSTINTSIFLDSFHIQIEKEGKYLGSKKIKLKKCSHFSNPHSSFYIFK